MCKENHYYCNMDKEATLAFQGKIAIVTSSISSNEEETLSAAHLIRKHGADKIMHIAWPENFMIEQRQMVAIFSELAADKEIKAVIISHAVPGSNAAVDKLKETRPDVFITYCSPQEETADVARRASMVFLPDYFGMGPVMVKQAKKQGAKVFVHYSFPRHMSQVSFSGRLDLIRKTCTEEGIRLVDAAVLDPAGEAGITAAQQFIYEDVWKMAAKYGEDTAFFCTNCHLQSSLIKAVVDCHAIFPQPCCPSPYHGFPKALGIKTDGTLPSLNFVISEACSIAAEKNMTDRLSTWPVSACMMFINAGVAYAIKWINEEVPKDKIANDVLLNCMENYIAEAIGEDSNVYMSSYSENGITYDNFKRVLMGYLDL